MNPIVKWFIKREIKRKLKQLGFHREERNDMLQKLEGIMKLGWFPKGWLTLTGGWGALLDGTVVPFMCLIHHPIVGVPCPDNPAQALLISLVGVIGIGLGRRS